MKSLNTKLALSALGIALLATPAFAQKPQHQSYRQQELNAPATADPSNVGVYPNGAQRTGSADSVQSGAEFNVLKD
jgi:hypothetical protein